MQQENIVQSNIQSSQSAFMLDENQLKKIPKFKQLWTLVDVLNEAWEKKLNAENNTRQQDILSKVEVGIHGGPLRDMIGSQFEKREIPISDWDILLLVPLELMLGLPGQFTGLSQRGTNLFELEDNGLKVDLAVYFEEGLDKVTLFKNHSIKVDLSVNAVVMSITKDGAGEIFDFHGSINDIEKLIFRTIEKTDNALGQTLVFGNNPETNSKKTQKMMRIPRIFTIEGKQQDKQWSYEELLEGIQKCADQFNDANFVDYHIFSAQLFKSFTTGNSEFFLSRLCYFNIAGYCFPHFARYQKEFFYIAKKIDAYIRLGGKFTHEQLFGLILWPSLLGEIEQITTKNNIEKHTIIELAIENVLNNPKIYLKSLEKTLSLLWGNILKNNSKIASSEIFEEIAPDKNIVKQVNQVVNHKVEPSIVASPVKTSAKNKAAELAIEQEAKAKKQAAQEQGTKEQALKEAAAKKAAEQRQEEKELKRAIKKEKREFAKELQRKAQEELDKKNQEVAEKLAQEQTAKEQAKKLKEQALRNAEEENKLRQAEEKARQKAKKLAEKKAKEIADKKAAAELKRQVSNSSKPKKEKKKPVEAISLTNTTTQEVIVKEENGHSLQDISNKSKSSLLVNTKNEKIVKKLSELAEFLQQNKIILSPQQRSLMSFWYPAFLENPENPRFHNLTFIRPIYGALFTIFGIVKSWYNEKAILINTALFYSILGITDNLILLIKKHTEKEKVSVIFPGTIRFPRNFSMLNNKIIELVKLYEKYDELLKKQKKIKQENLSQEVSNWLVASVIAIGIGMSLTLANQGKIEQNENALLLKLSFFFISFYGSIIWFHNHAVNIVGMATTKEKQELATTMKSVEGEISELQGEVKKQIDEEINKLRGDIPPFNIVQEESVTDKQSAP